MSPLNRESLINGYRTSTTLSGFASINLAGFLLPVLLSFQCFFFAVTISCKMNHRGMVY